MSLLDEAAVATALRAFFPPGREVEIRALWPKGDKRSRVKRSADVDDLVDFARQADADQAKGIYVVMNPFEGVKGKAVHDEDVVKREWLLVDVDPVRESGAAATAGELKASLRVLVDAYGYLKEKGWPDPFVAISGNGGHLMYRVDLGTSGEETELVRRCLETLAWKFGTKKAQVDTSVYNLSRIWKLPGTVSRKGIPTDERPWRLAHLRKMGGGGTVEKEKLEALAITIDEGDGDADDNGELGKLRSWLHANWPQLGEPKPYLGGTGRRWVFGVCPWDASHRDRSAYIIRFASGAIVAGCLHDSCKGHERDDSDKSMGWRHLQELAESRFVRVQAGVIVGASTLLSPRTTHLGNVQRLVASHGATMRYVPQWSQWLRWDGMRWKESIGHAERVAMTLSASVFAAASIEPDVDEAKRLYKWAVACESAKVISASVRLAQCHDVFQTEAGMFDQDDWALNCENGILDLKTGKLGPHRPDALMTKQVSVEYRGDSCVESLCPRWLEFLDVVFNHNVELIQFIQRAVGYCLTGSVEEQVMFLCHGGGSNGKTTFVRTIQSILGDYATQVDSNILMSSKDEQHSTGLTDLMGKRFAGASESDRSRHLGEARIKQLTGDDVISARRMRQDFVRFSPSHKLWLLVNHKPIIKGNDEGIWRRLVYVPFTVHISNEQKDRQLRQKLEQEAAGIFQWMVQGCREWQRIGLTPPQVVLDEVADYKSDMDLLKDFFEECCDVGEKYRVPKRDLFEVYKDWCEPLNNKAGNIKFFGRLMMERGFKETVTKVKDAQGVRRSVRFWKGVRIGTAAGAGQVVEVDFGREG